MSIFEVLRDRVGLEQIVSANGSSKARCVSPDHHDQDPSMHLYDDHAHCFACGFHGDVTDAWAAMRGFNKPVEAALDLAREFDVQLPEFSEEGRRRADERRRKEEKDLATVQMLLRRLKDESCGGWDAVQWWEGRGFTPELRNRFLLSGTPRTAVIPFWRPGGRIFGLIRRHLDGKPKYQNPEGERPLFIPGPLGQEIFVVEGYIDALAVAATGRSAIAVGGTNISEAQGAELRGIISQGATIYILPDYDENGAQAARAWGREFFPQARVCQPSYGEGAKDIADAFASDGVKKTADLLDRLVSASRDILDIEAGVCSEVSGGPREKLAYATENIVPLLAQISPTGMQDATADIVCEQIGKGFKKSWINKAIKDEETRRFTEQIRATMLQEEAERERLSQEHQEKVADAQEEIDALLTPGVLERLRDTAAAMHNVYGDKEPLELALLVALGAQLEPLPNGRPLGASILLTAQAGRGKNHIVDAAVKPLPEEFYFAFEIASGQSLYYKADEDPEFLKHTFAYPNEIEGAEALWEFLRPMLSKGRAKKIVTAKDTDGNMTTREITVEGPVTIAIPTIRNKTDEQLQTRLLVAELPDYPGRVKEHSSALSAQLLPDAATADYSRERWLWQEGLRQLTSHRRVVFPLRHPDFALDDDQVSHGARLWANLLSVMATHAWLEQRNRRLLDLGEGRVAIEATPDDYAAAYRIFNKVCKRTVVNISDTHRRILNSLYDLQQQFPNRKGFAQREIAKEGKDVPSDERVSQGSISNNKTFLITSAKLIKETEHGLALVEGAEPSWWSQDGIMMGLPTPEQVKAWWDDSHPDPDPPSKGANWANHLITEDETGDKADTYGERDDQRVTNQGLITISADGDQDQRPDSDYSAISKVLISENGLPKRDAAERQGCDYVISSISDSGSVEPLEEKNGRITAEQAERIRSLVKEGMSETWARRTVLADGHPPGCGCEVCL